ncbi:hypothetical protein [Paracoccus sp. NSM]|uniref:hypothetical protein n=1 Tax=Paracoccus sp. NSM TaxID=3457784 RepID=UPI00403749C7
MSHNHEPPKAASRHKPALIAIAVALLAALIAFMVFRPGVVDDGGDGIANTAPPASVPTTEAAGREEETAPPVTSDALTPEPATTGAPMDDPATPSP